MAAFRFLHAADLHMDSPLASLGDQASAAAAQVLRASREALERMVELALSEGVAFSVIAGDLLDGAVNDHASVQHLMSQLGKLARHAPVYLVRGNHDAVNSIGANLRWPPGVHELPHARPGTVEISELKVSIHGRSFRDRRCDNDIAAGYPDPVLGHFNIGILHTSLAGSPGHGSYAPTTAERLSAKGYDYWALGHVHTRSVVRERGPAIVFPGNIQGRSIRETGPRGCALVTVGEDRLPTVEFRDLDAARFLRLEVDLEGIAAVGEWVDRLREAVRNSSLSAINITRVVFRGATAFPPRAGEDLERETAEVLAGAGGSNHLESVRVECKEPGVPGPDLSAARDHFLRVLDRWARDPGELRTILAGDVECTEIMGRCGNTVDEDFKREFLAEFPELRAVMGELEGIGRGGDGGDRR